MRLTDFYNQITRLPLFQGIGAQDLVKIQERGALKFLSLDNEDGILLEQGKRCVMMTWLLEGSLIRRTVSNDGLWYLDETICAPAIIEPEAVFSLNNELTSTWINKGNATIMCMTKEQVLQTLMHIDVCRTNLICMLSQMVQLQEYTLREAHSKNIREHILHFFSTIRHKGTRERELHIKMTDLASIVRETRLNVSRCLKDMEKDGLVKLKRGIIDISQETKNKKPETF